MYRRQLLEDRNVGAVALRRTNRLDELSRFIIRWLDTIHDKAVAGLHAIQKLTWGFQELLPRPYSLVEYP